jgi:hypothetical protein
MTRDELIIRLMLLEPIIMVPQAYNAAQQAEIYSVYNELTGENRRPNGCGACLNTVLTRLKKELRNIAKNG